MPGLANQLVYRRANALIPWKPVVLICTCPRYPLYARFGFGVELVHITGLHYLVGPRGN